LLISLEKKKEDVEDNEDTKIIFKVEGSQSHPSFVPGSQIDPEVQRSQTPEPVTWSSESPQIPW
jgi:hypothetical protein